MLKFSEELLESLQPQTNELVKRMANGENTADVLADFYASSLEGKTKGQGIAVAETILSTVANFDMDYMDYQEELVDVDHCIAKFQSKVDAQMDDAQQRCIYWKRVVLLINTITENADHPGSVDAAQLKAQLDGITFTKSEVTVELEKQLRTEAFDAFKSSSLAVGMLAENCEQLQNMLKAGESVTLLTAFTENAVNYRSALSMITYVSAMQGELDDVPAELSPEEISVCVCMQIEQLSVVQRLRRQDITMELAVSITGLIGLTGFLCLVGGGALYLSTTLLTVVSPFFSIPATIALVYFAMKLMINGVDAVCDCSTALAFDIIKSVRGFLRNMKGLYVKTSEYAEAYRKAETDTFELETDYGVQTAVTNA